MRKINKRTQISLNLERKAIIRRVRRVKLGRKNTVRSMLLPYWKSNNHWLAEKSGKGHLDYEISGKDIAILLPEKMNFSSEFDKTAVTLEAIRRFTKTARTPKTSVTLSGVNFSNLRKVSTSAALALTAELCRWEDFIGQKLVASLEEWDPDVADQLNQLGFFDLFELANAPETTHSSAAHGSRLLVRYIKAKCDDPDAFLDLEEEIKKLIGEVVEKWMFLHMGITEAITNVSHHAYPNITKTKRRDRNWYLTGSYDPDLRQLKIVFYDQGIGIPESLPASKIREKVAVFMADYGLATGRKDAILIRAAMEIARTSTGDDDRGKGLNDLVEFARQRQNGYLSILSNYGLYKITVTDGVVSDYTYAFRNRVLGTLIIWTTSAC